MQTMSRSPDASTAMVLDIYQRIVSKMKSLAVYVVTIMTPKTVTRVIKINFASIAKKLINEIAIKKSEQITQSSVLIVKH